MIEANEIRIGNRYNRKHGKGWTETVITAEILGSIFGPGLDYALNDFEPIPITYERLGELGFKGPGFFVLKTKSELFSISYDGQTFCLFDPGFGISSGIITFRSQFLHQLQNIFFALTGKEIETCV